MSYILSGNRQSIVMLGMIFNVIKYIDVYQFFAISPVLVHV